jgi:hypothetical protein
MHLGRYLRGFGFAVLGGVFACAAPHFTHSAGAAENANRASKEASEPSKAAIERTRKEVKMLDDLYKTAVVLMTKTYVDKQLDSPAAIVAIQMFDAMKKNGWHEARLVDATGKPKSKVNLPETAFEKAAIEQIKDGKPYYDEVGEKDGKPVLRAATVVPAVLNTCAACHGMKKGDLLGAIVYEVPIK